LYLGGGYFGGALLDCVPCINRDVDVQSTAGDGVGALEEGGDECGGDLLGFSVLEFMFLAHGEEGLADGWVLGEEGADGGELPRAEAVFEAVEVAFGRACAGAAASVFAFGFGAGLRDVLRPLGFVRDRHGRGPFRMGWGSGVVFRVGDWGRRSKGEVAGGRCSRE